LPNSDLAHMQSFLYIRVRFSLYTCRVFYVNFVFSILGYHHRLTDDGGIQNNIYFEVSMCSRYRWYRTHSCLEKNNSWYGGCLAHLHFASTLFSNLYYSFIYGRRAAPRQLVFSLDAAYVRFLELILLRYFSRSSRVVAS